MSRRPFSFGALLALALLSASLAQARTWTDTQGRTIEADYLSATETEVTVRRADNLTFTLPLTRLSTADQEFVAAQLAAEKARPAADFEKFNNLIGLPLLADASLWDDTPADAAARINLPLEGKTDRFEGYRGYPPEPYPIIAAGAYMISLQAAEGRITSLVIQFANRGDHPAFRRQDTRLTPSKAELKAFEQTLTRDFDALSAALSAELGDPTPEIAVGGLDPGRRSLRWEWHGHALFVSHDPGQMVSLKLLPTGRATPPRLADAEVRRLFKERISRRANGDVILDQIPMVDQGPKGYCVPATFERYLRYAGIPADMYELAAVGGVEHGGGGHFTTMTQGLDRFVRRHGRRLQQVSFKLTPDAVARYIDEGRPVIWGLYSTAAFNALADLNTSQRQASTALFDMRKSLSKQELDALMSDPDAAHACLIIGYNRKTGEIALSDSWGPDFRERWVPAAAAAKVSQDEYWVLAW